MAVFKGGSASGAGSDADKVQKREYYYADELLKSGKITKEQYDLGIAKAALLQTKASRVVFNPELHNQDNA